jgi:NAD-dependent DNA ligase
MVMSNFATNKEIANDLFESLEKLLDAKWTTWQTVDHAGKRTVKHVVEYQITEELDESK